MRSRAEIFNLQIIMNYSVELAFELLCRNFQFKKSSLFSGEPLLPTSVLLTVEASMVSCQNLLKVYVDATDHFSPAVFCKNIVNELEQFYEARLIPFKSLPWITKESTYPWIIDNHIHINSFKEFSNDCRIV